MRISSFQKELASKKIDCALIFSLDEEPNKSMVYLAGYSGLGVLAVLNSKCFILAPEMEYEKARETGLSVFKSDRKKKFLDNLSLLLSKEDINAIGIEYNKCNYLLYLRIRKALRKKTKDISGCLLKMRMIKDADEISSIKKACNVTDNLFSKICKNFSFKTEIELKYFIEEEIKKAGCDLAFPPIVASGKGTSLPHYVPSNKKIKKGFLMLDFGARFNGYCSDMTRMIYIGRPNKEEIKNYSLVLTAVNKCEEAALSEKKFSRLYELSVKALGAKSKYFIHSLGHGLGLDIHESPSLNAEDKNKIVEFCPFTIEPGIYFSGKYGIRIEDTIVIKDKKIVVLTQSTKELVCI